MQEQKCHTSCKKYNFMKHVTVQLTGNVAGTRTTRHASTRETHKGAGMLRGIASKTMQNHPRVQL